MRSPLEQSELDELVDQLDTQITEVAADDDIAALSGLLCGLDDRDDDGCPHWH
ncbi:hypothetical protein [Actinokineospora sp. UTMC 2448]|uniref:hypothetical protein n=1 Tax=Actinokineospora sp. UTMC 2448 TaxID=2268449 RepID=UPI00216494E0|nr:hypothetical protein [Actinokineospora sp. UTMC 2448]UVS78172.1 hypothetical protein Actkin_01896 [Actinokineospora sp. UTMC 2448]